LKLLYHKRSTKNVHVDADGIIIIIIHTFLYRHKVVTSEAVGKAVHQWTTMNMVEGVAYLN